MVKEIEVIKKLLLVITIVVLVSETMNELKNDFSAKNVRFRSIATFSFIDNGR